MTTFFAIEGAITGTLGLIISAQREFRTRKPRVRLQWRDVPREEINVGAMALDVANVGLREVHIEGPIWELGAREWAPSQGPQLWDQRPVDNQLSPGAFKTYVILNDDLREFSASGSQKTLRVGVVLDGKRRVLIACM